MMRQHQLSWNSFVTTEQYQVLTLLLKQVDFTRCNLSRVETSFCRDIDDFGFSELKNVFQSPRVESFFLTQSFFTRRNIFSRALIFFSQGENQIAFCKIHRCFFFVVQFFIFSFPLPFLFLLCKIISSVRPSCSVFIKLGGWNLVFDCRGLKSIILCLILTDKFLTVTAPPQLRLGK